MALQIRTKFRSRLTDVEVAGRLSEPNRWQAKWSAKDAGQQREPGQTNDENELRKWTSDEECGVGEQRSRASRRCDMANTLYS